jgi:predicted membrane protein
MNNRGLSTQLLFGILVILIGALLLLDNLSVLDISGIWRWIPSLFILLGFWQLLVNGFRHWVGPLILIGGGAIFQLAALELLSWETVGGLIWPIALIIVGLLVILNRSRFGQDHGMEVDSSDTVNIFAMFNGISKQVQSSNFKGGEVTTAFGGAELDLNQVSVADKPARINVTAMFGGAEIRVPADWQVNMNIIGLFGGSSDERQRPSDLPESGPADVVISGLAMFGGVTVKS